MMKLFCERLKNLNILQKHSIITPLEHLWEGGMSNE